MGKRRQTPGQSALGRIPQNESNLGPQDRLHGVGQNLSFSSVGPSFLLHLPLLNRGCNWNLRPGRTGDKTCETFPPSPLEWKRNSSARGSVAAPGSGRFPPTATESQPGGDHQGQRGGRAAVRRVSGAAGDAGERVGWKLFARLSLRAPAGFLAPGGARCSVHGARCTVLRKNPALAAPSLHRSPAMRRDQTPRRGVRKERLSRSVKGSRRHHRWRPDSCSRSRDAKPAPG